MAMGTRKQREKQEDIWIAHTELASAPGHPFYQRLNELLEAEGFDEFVEGRCAKFYAAKYGRPSLTPGIYFRSLLIGYFEGIDSDRGISWRLADSLALRRFVGIALDEYTPDHSTISRTWWQFWWHFGLALSAQRCRLMRTRQLLQVRRDRIIAGVLLFPALRCASVRYALKPARTDYESPPLPLSYRPVFDVGFLIVNGSVPPRERKQGNCVRG